MGKIELHKYPSLNGLRAISIILVINLHLNLRDSLYQHIEKTKWVDTFLTFIQDGVMGVNIFFIISGFLITTVLIREEEKTGTISLVNFCKRRIFRIFPAYYFLLLVYFILQLFHVIHISTTSWLHSITYTKYFNSSLDDYTSHFWSLSLEELFYFFWPLFFIQGNKVRKIAAISILILVPLIRVYNHKYDTTFEEQLYIFAKIDAIAFGCFFAMYKDRINAILSRNWTLAFYISVLIIFFLRHLPGIANKIHLGYIFIPLGKSEGTLANLVIAIIMMYSVFGPRRLWFKFLNLRIINYIGILSYSMYLWQQLFIIKSNQIFTSFALNIALLIVMVLFSYYVIEKPFLKLKDKYGR